jgi:hypothetical protein
MRKGGGTICLLSQQLEESGDEVPEIVSGPPCVDCILRILSKIFRGENVECCSMDTALIFSRVVAGAGLRISAKLIPPKDAV